MTESQQFEHLRSILRERLPLTANSAQGRAAELGRNKMVDNQI
jgi:hypothetical protein